MGWAWTKTRTLTGGIMMGTEMDLDLDDDLGGLCHDGDLEADESMCECCWWHDPETGLCLRFPGRLQDQDD